MNALTDGPASAAANPPTKPPASSTTATRLSVSMGPGFSHAAGGLG
ncbi:MAG: hypothetical protein FJ086_09750 [Deltaproteobacteria bacterium]|nr:hypothetical protein [Deltaproteobacteria bacterium]